MEGKYSSSYEDKQNYERKDHFVLAAVFVLSFFMSEMIYEVLEDDHKGYFDHINYPILSKSIELIYADVELLTKPFLDIIPKDRY